MRQGVQPGTLVYEVLTAAGKASKVKGGRRNPESQGESSSGGPLCQPYGSVGEAITRDTFHAPRGKGGCNMKSNNSLVSTMVVLLDGFDTPSATQPKGLPCGELMDYTVYRDIIPDRAWSGQDVPAEAVAGAISAAFGDYASGLLVAVYNLGAGRFILNTLRIRENLGSDPIAERLLRNMLNYASRDVSKPPVELPSDFDAQLEAMGL